MSLSEALPWILAFGMGGLLWLALREYTKACKIFVEMVKLNNERVQLLNELMAAIGKQIPTPQLPHGNTQAERRG